MSENAELPGASIVAQASRTSIWQPRQPVFWLLLVGIVVGLIQIVIGVAAGVRTEKYSLSIVLAAAGLCALQGVFLWFLARWFPRVRLIPLPVQLGAILAGGTFGVILAGELNTVIGDALDGFGLSNLSAAFSAPFVEDAIRMTCVVLLLGLLAARKLTAVDGVVIGFLVGTGFEIFENLYYAFRAADFAGAVQMMLGRTSMGFGLHPMWTAIAAGAVAYVWARVQRKQSSRWWVIVPAYVLPMLLHAAWDSPGATSLMFFRLFEFFLWYTLTIAAFVFVLVLSRRNEWHEYGGALTKREWRKLGRRERLAYVPRNLGE